MAFSMQQDSGMLARELVWMHMRHSCLLLQRLTDHSGCVSVMVHDSSCFVERIHLSSQRHDVRLGVAQHP